MSPKTQIIGKSYSEASSYSIGGRSSKKQWNKASQSVKSPDSKANFASVWLCNLLKVITIPATIFCLDNETVWFAFRPKTLRDSLKKKKKIGNFRVCIDGMWGLHTKSRVEGSKQNLYVFYSVGQLLDEKSCDDCSNRSHSYNCRETKGRWEIKRAKYALKHANYCWVLSIDMPGLLSWHLHP